MLKCAKRTWIYSEVEKSGIITGNVSSTKIKVADFKETLLYLAPVWTQYLDGKKGFSSEMIQL